MEVQSTSSTGRVIRSRSQTESAGPVLNNRVKNVKLFRFEINRTLTARDAGLHGMKCLCGISETKKEEKNVLIQFHIVVLCMCFSEGHLSRYQDLML